MLRSIFNRIFLFYSLLIFALIAFICTAVFVVVSQGIRETKMQDMTNVADMIAGQVDLRIKGMNQISNGVLANTAIRQSLLALNGYDYRTVNMFIYLEAYGKLSDNLFTLAQPFPDIDRIAVFTDKNMFFSSKRFDAKSETLKARLEQKLWPGMGNQAVPAGFYLEGPHYDLWDEAGSKMVFTLQRIVKGIRGPIGLIEIQGAYKILEEICDIGVGHVYIVDADSALIYPARPESLPSPGIGWDALRDFAVSHESFGAATVLESGGAEERYILTRRSSDFSGWTVVYSQSERSILEPVYTTLGIIVLIGLAGTLVSMVVAYLIAGHVYKPLRKLKTKVEAFDFQALGSGAHAIPDSAFAGTDSEIVVLNYAFDAMVAKLGQSVEETIAAQSKSQKTYFKMLQSQINPHFLHNSLSVISVMARDLGDAKIPDLCRNLTSLLKYSSDLSREWVTVEDEMENAAAYLSLLKYRYEHRLEYTLDIDGAMAGLKIPKMTLQPLIENSMKHGMFGIDWPLRVVVSGFRKADRWFLRVEDNGAGFSEISLDRIRRTISDFEAGGGGVLDHVESDKLGLGILNTFIRLRIFFGGRLDFAAGPGSGGGAAVEFSVADRDAEPVESAQGTEAEERMRRDG